MIYQIPMFFLSDRYVRERQRALFLVNAVMAGEMTVVSSTLTEVSNLSFSAEPSLHSVIDFLFLSN